MATPLTNIYQGSWTDWARGPITGYVITLNNHGASIIESFLAVLISFTGAHLWSIICFAIHQARATQKPRDMLHYQQQAVLRNATADLTTVWRLIALSWQWRKHSRRPILRCVGLVALAALHIAAMIVAGIFVSTAVTVGSDCLMRSSLCGGFKHAASLASMATVSSTLGQSITIARICADSNRKGVCGSYLPSGSTKNLDAPCPFDDEFCQKGTSAVEFDTGHVNSNTGFGINTPAEDQITFRSTLTCAPLNIKSYFNQSNWSLNYGTIWTNACGPGCSFYLQYPHDKRLPMQQELVQIYSLYWSPYVNNSFNTFSPLPGLRRDDADTTITILVNRAEYAEKVLDPFFEANKEVNSTVPSRSGKAWVTSLPFTSLGCAQQIQFCNANPHFDGEERCTDLAERLRFLDTNHPAHPNSTTFAGLGLSDNQMSVVSRFVRGLYAGNINDMVDIAGKFSLLADQDIFGPQATALPADQWIHEVNNWHKIMLINLQKLIEEWVVGPDNPEFKNEVTPPDTYDNADFTKYLCENQRIADQQYTNISVLRFTIIVVVCMAIITARLVLQSCISGVFRRRCHHNNPSHSHHDTSEKFAVTKGYHKLFEWRMESFLNLQRLAYENRGLGVWTSARDGTPLTVGKRGEAAQVFPLPAEEKEMFPDSSEIELDLS